MVISTSIPTHLVWFPRHQWHRKYWAYKHSVKFLNLAVVDQNYQQSSLFTKSDCKRISSSEDIIVSDHKPWVAHLEESNPFFPHDNVLLYKVWLEKAEWFRSYCPDKIWTQGQMDWQTEVVMPTYSPRSPNKLIIVVEVGGQNKDCIQFIMLLFLIYFLHKINANKKETIFMWVPGHI